MAKRSCSIWFALSLIGVMGIPALWVYMDQPEEVEPIVDVMQAPDLSTAITSNEPITPLEAPLNIDPRKRALGKRLFHDPLFSVDGTISCSSCHDLKRGGTDQLPISKGIADRMGTVNAPTIFNVALNFSFFWDGRARSLEQQMDGPIHDINEMGSSWPIITDRLNARDDYRSEFLAIYKSRASEFTIKDAIAAYERSLITLNAPFDRYLRGDRDALTEQQSYGYTLFKNFGCVACHQGRGVGGNMFQVLGVVHSYFDERGNITKADYGRFNVTGDERDRFRFKVPSLRNVALTAPYFHDGSAATLDDAVRTMARYQLGRTLSNEDLAAIVAFLNSLTGETPDP